MVILSASAEMGYSIFCTSYLMASQTIHLLSGSLVPSNQNNGHRDESNRNRLARSWDRSSGLIASPAGFAALGIVFQSYALNINFLLSAIVTLTSRRSLFEPLAQLILSNHPLSAAS